MTYVVTETCIRCKYMDCVEVCPVDCFYVGANMLVIHPDECIDCGVCEPECPVEAIIPDTDGEAEVVGIEPRLFREVAEYHPQGELAGRCRHLQRRRRQIREVLRRSPRRSLVRSSQGAITRQLLGTIAGAVKPRNAVLSCCQFGDGNFRRHHAENTRAQAHFGPDTFIQVVSRQEAVDRETLRRTLQLICEQSSPRVEKEEVNRGEEEKGRKRECRF